MRLFLGEAEREFPIKETPVDNLKVLDIPSPKAYNAS